MRRLPLIASFLLFIVLCASIAYWALQLFKPPLRPVAASPRAAQAEVRPEAAALLFGGRAGNVAVASNYQLRGVIFSGNPRDSIAILSADGKPAQAVRVNMEVLPGVTVKEVHRDYVLLAEGDATKRVELPESVKGQVNIAAAAPVRAQPVTPPPPAIPPSNGQSLTRAKEAAAAAIAGTPPPAAPVPAPPSPSNTVAVQPPAPVTPTPIPPQSLPAQPATAAAPPTAVVNPSSGGQPAVSGAPPLSAPAIVAPMPGQPPAVVQPPAQPTVPGTLQSR